MSTVHISQLTFLESMFHTSLQLQFTHLTVSIIFVEMCLKNNRKKEIIKRNYAKYKFRSLWFANYDFEKFLLGH